MLRGPTGVTAEQGSEFHAWLWLQCLAPKADGTSGDVAPKTKVVLPESEAPLLADREESRYICFNSFADLARSPAYPKRLNQLGTSPQTPGGVAFRVRLQCKKADAAPPYLPLPQEKAQGLIKDETPQYVPPRWLLCAKRRE